MRKPLLGDYEYDACGRVTYDPIRNLTIEWNRLGMPVSIKNEAEDEYAFEYLADGTLLRAGGRTYAGSFILDEDGAVEKLTFADGVSTSEGLVDYYLRDHLGSVRASVDGMSEDYGQLSYSPYGVSSTSEDYPGGSILHTFIGKEKVRIADESAWTQQPYLNFGARLYDAATGHFLSTDPLAEKYFGINPYIYCAGDPVNSLDPNGEEKIIAMIHFPKMNELPYRNLPGGEGMKQFRKHKAEYLSNETLISNMKAAKDYNKMLGVFAHGYNKGKQIVIVNKRNEHHVLNAKGLAQYLIGESQLIKENDSVVIVLNSCQTGNGPESVGAQLSQVMDGSIVIAPTCNVDASGQGSEDGKWNVFVDGEVVDSTNATKEDYQALMDQYNNNQEAYKR